MRGDRSVGRLPLFVLWLLCAGFPPIAAAAVPSWHRQHTVPQAVGSGARVAITSAGDVAVAWQDTQKGLSVAVRPAGGRFGSPQRLSRSGRWVQRLDVIADSRGALVVVWSDAECCHSGSPDKRVWASTREPGGRFSAPVAVSEPFYGTEPTPAAAAGDDGSLTVVWWSENWSGTPGATETGVEVADRLPGGGFG